MSMIFMMNCFLVFRDSTRTAKPKLPFPTTLTFLYFYILIFNGLIIKNMVSIENQDNINNIWASENHYKIPVTAHCYTPHFLAPLFSMK